MAYDEVKLDLGRGTRIGIDEAIYCPNKSSEQLEVILERFALENRSCLLTRLEPRQYTDITPGCRAKMDYDEVSRTAYFGWREETLADPEVAILTAGSSDVPVAREALRTLGYFHVGAMPFFDVGVAGLWRLMKHIDDIRRYPIAIVAAGMDAALPSVLGGLYPGLIVAVPTSVGYGASEGGKTALNAILASCASGVVAVNIDNGYGAACAALRVLNPRGVRARASSPVAAIDDTL